MQRREKVPMGWAFLLCLLFVLGGCRSLFSVSVGPFGGGAEGSSGRISADELRSYLATYASVFQGTVTVAADTIRANTRDPEVRRRTLLWKLRVTPLAYQTALLPDPLQSYVLLFSLAVAQKEFLTNGDGAMLFGNDQQIAIDTAQDLVQGIEQIGGRFLSHEELQRVTQQVDEFSSAHPMRGEFVVDRVEAISDATRLGGRFDWIVRMPLSPFTALKGVDSGAQAIREFNQTALRFTQVAAALPTFMRWNLELLVYDIETHHTVESGLAAFETLAQSAQQFSQVAASLPSDLGREASQLVAQVDASQGQMQRTLESARSALAEANGVAKSFEPVAAALDRTAAQLNQAGVAWTGMISAIRSPADDAAKNPSESRPFDIHDYERTAAEITQAAIQLRGLVSDTQAASDGVTRRLVDHLAWRGLQLMVAFFVILFLYRRIEARLGGRGAPPLG